MTEPSAHTAPPSTVVLQPWWQNAGYGGVATDVMPEETTSKPPASNVTDRRQGAKGGPSQQPDGSSNENVDGRKGMLDVEREAGSSRSCEQEQQRMQSVASAIPPMMPDYFLPHTQLELGQTIACAPYSYTDPYCGGTVASYETQALVHSQLLGMPQTRMALPLDMAEEPVYVNAKQYHGILRRRQSRAKAELEKKLIKVRKPYLHESRHQHALRRARGCGGRFLNTTKSDGNSTASSVDKSGTSAGNTLSICLRNPDSGNNKQEVNDTGEPDIYKCNGNGNGGLKYTSYQVSDFHSVTGDGAENGDCSGQQWNGIRVDRSPHRAVATQ